MASNEQYSITPLSFRRDMQNHLQFLETGKSRVFTEKSFIPPNDTLAQITPRFILDVLSESGPLMSHELEHISERYLSIADTLLDKQITRKPDVERAKNLLIAGMNIGTGLRVSRDESYAKDYEKFEKFDPENRSHLEPVHVKNKKYYVPGAIRQDIVGRVIERTSEISSQKKVDAWYEALKALLKNDIPSLFAGLHDYLDHHGIISEFQTEYFENKYLGISRIEPGKNTHIKIHETPTAYQVQKSATYNYVENLRPEDIKYFDSLFFNIVLK